MGIEVLTVSSKGQIVLPVKMRRTIGITDGDKLAAFASDDGVIMLKVVKVPTVQDFKVRLDEAKDWAESVGYKEGDISDIIKSVRLAKRENSN